MRVLFWSSTFLPKIGGIEILAAKLLPALRDRGYEFMVVTSLSSPDLPRETSYGGIPVHRFPFLWWSANDLDRVMTLRQGVAQLKRNFAPDLIHINGTHISAFFHLTTAAQYPVPSLVTLHNERFADDRPEHNAGNDTMLGRILRSADWVSCVSAAVLVEVRRLVPEIGVHSSVIHNGLAIPPLAPTPLPFHAPQVLCLGRLVARKGFDLALSAFATIASRVPTVRMVVAGDGPARAPLEKQAAELGLRDSVDFVGWVAPENVPALINTATIVVMPSRWEPFGLVALEAAQMARPIVATRVGGLTEVVEHGQTGLLVDNENPDALAKAMAELLEHPQVTTRMGETARSRAIERFSWSRCVDAYDSVYRKLMHAAAGRRTAVVP
jgi:glycogen(starch) synthase